MKYFMSNVLFGCFLLQSVISFSQLDQNALFTLPEANTTLEMNSVSSPKQGTLIFNNEDDQVYYFNGTNWLPFYGADIGMQYYTWDISNTSSPNINNPRNRGVSTSQGSVQTALDNTLRGLIAPDNEGYVILIKGVLKVNNTGNFTFTSESDDGSRIYIDNIMVLNSWFDQGSTTRSASVDLAKGEHKIEFWYYENSGADFMEFTWGANPDGYTTGSTINANQFFVK